MILKEKKKGKKNKITSDKVSCSILYKQLTFDSHEWSRHNFSWQYQCNIKQPSDENKEKCQKN